MFRALESLADEFAGGTASTGHRESASASRSEACAAGKAGEASRGTGSELSDVDANFAAQIATAVWIGNLNDAAAREALLSYAIACQLCDRAHLIRFREALIAEYAYCRERQDLVS